MPDDIVLIGHSTGGLESVSLNGKLVRELRGETVLLLIAAHGGPGGAMDELEIPWIISGPGARGGQR